MECKHLLVTESFPKTQAAHCRLPVVLVLLIIIIIFDIIIFDIIIFYIRYQIPLVFVGCMSGIVMMQVMHMEPHEFSELEKVEATDDCGEASTSRPALGEIGVLHCNSSPITTLAGCKKLLCSLAMSKA